MSRFRLLALDIDGTLLNGKRIVSPRVCAALAAACEAGVKVVLVTGRRHPAAREVAHMAGLDGVPLVLHNGALVLENGRVLYCRPLPRADALRALEIGLRFGADPVLHCGHAGEGRLVVAGVRPTNTLLVYYLDRSGTDVERVENLAAAVDEDPVQVMFGGAIEELTMLAPALAEGLGPAVRIERTFYPARGVGIVDVLERSVGKAVALARLQERWGITAGETLAIGDNANDREMLEAAGLGMVMGNALPEMLALGFPVLPSNEDDGVAVAIERYVLMR